MADISQVNLPNGNTYNISAVTLGSSDVGSNINPIYLNGGVPTPCSYTVKKSVPSDAVFTDTTYSSLPAQSGGTDVSLVTTGEKYTWNNAGGSNTWEGTQAQYDALPSHDPDTIYYITDGSPVNTNLDDLADVNILNPTDGDTLKYSSGSWVNSAVNVTQDISDQYTITKTSGNWKVNEISAVRTGNVVHMRVEMSGNGSSVSAGSNGFVGTLSGGALPSLSIKLIAFYNNCPIMMNIEPDGALAARVTATSVTVTSSGKLVLTGTFITNN